MKNPGRLLQMPDGRKVILYNKQPLLNEHKKLLFHLIDEEFRIVTKENGDPKTIIMDVGTYNSNRHTWKAIGMVD